MENRSKIVGTDVPGGPKQNCSERYLRHQPIEKGDIMYKLDKILQKVFIIIGILVTIFIFTIATASYQLRKDFEEHKYERLTTAEPPKSIEWYQAAGKRPPE